MRAAASHRVRGEASSLRTPPGLGECRDVSSGSLSPNVWEDLPPRNQPRVVEPSVYGPEEIALTILRALSYPWRIELVGCHVWVRCGRRDRARWRPGRADAGRMRWSDQRSESTEIRTHSQMKRGLSRRVREFRTVRRE